MTKYILSIILMWSVGFAVHSQINETDDQGRKQGEWIKLYPNSKVPIYEGQFIDDKPTGKFTYYYPNNKIKSIVRHDHKTGRSEAFMYTQDKQLLAHGIYINQKKDSVWTHYNFMGTLAYKETYKDDVLHGKKTVYYLPVSPEDNRNRIMQEIHFEEGVLNGPVKEYFPDGVLKTEGKYKDGRYDGLVKHYRPNETLDYEERWKNKNKHGWSIAYDAQGKEVVRRYYYHGEELEGKELKKHLQELKAKGINPNK